jgi:hypothetical protein
MLYINIPAVLNNTVLVELQVNKSSIDQELPAAMLNIKMCVCLMTSAVPAAAARNLECRMLQC